jgi:CheY-like chemotaxis protein
LRQLRGKSGPLEQADDQRTGAGHVMLAERCECLIVRCKFRHAIDKETATSARIDSGNRRQYGVDGLGDISVVIARNGYEGLIEVCAHQPQIVIADLSMPQFDGFKMLRILDNDPKHRPAHFIVVSGLGAEEIASAGGLPQGSHLIPKKQLTSALIHELVSQQSGAMKIGK